MNDGSFDTKGNFYPYEIVNIDINAFEAIFVKGFEISSTRQNLFHGYISYTTNLCETLKSELSQWINGSYTTNKTNPNDVDLVNFVNAQILDIHCDNLFPFLSQYDSKALYHVDGYAVPVYDSSDERYELTEFWHSYWRDWLGHDRNGNPKGIIEIDMNQETLKNIGNKNE